MSQRDTFEMQLTAALRDYVEEAPAQVDAATYVRAITTEPRGVVRPRVRVARYGWLLLAALVAVGLIAASILGFGGRPAVVLVPSPTASASPGQSFGPAGAVAFTRQGDLWLLIDGDADPVRVAEDVALEGVFAGNSRWLYWSPDGSMLAVANSQPPDAGPSALLISILDWETQSLRELTDATSAGLPVGWTRDDELLGDRHDGTLAATDPQSGLSRDLSSEGVCQAAFSPDGEWIAATRGDAVVVASSSDLEWTEIGFHAGYDCGPFTGWDGPTWSPDSKRLAFVSGYDGRTGEPVSFEPPARTTITVATRDGDEPVALTEHADAWAVPKWSPTGEWIAFRAQDGLRVIRPDGTDSRLIFEGVVDRGRLDWASDGSRIDFGVTPRGADHYGPTEVWSFDMESGLAEPLALGGLVTDFARRP